MRFNAVLSYSLTAEIEVPKSGANGVIVALGGGVGGWNLYALNGRLSFRPLINSDRFLQRESIAYAKATVAGSRVFQASSASRTFCIALSRVNGGKGGLAGVSGTAMIFFSGN